LKTSVDVSFEFLLLVSSATILSNAAYDGFALSSGQEAISEEEWVPNCARCSYGALL
jgi:hypothetical protein